MAGHTMNQSNRRKPGAQGIKDALNELIPLIYEGLRRSSAGTWHWNAKATHFGPPRLSMKATCDWWI